MLRSGLNRRQRFGKPGDPVPAHVKILAALARKNKREGTWYGALTEKTVAPKPERLVGICFEPLDRFVQNRIRVPGRSRIAFLTVQDHDETESSFVVEFASRTRRQVGQPGAGVGRLQRLPRLLQGASLCRM